MKRKVLNRWKIFFFTFIIGLLYWQMKINKNVANNDTIYIGMMNGWAPYMSIDSNGEMVGFDVDIVKKMEEVLPQIYHGRKKIEIVDLGSLSALFLALDKGKVDAIMSGLDITAKRKENYDIIFYRDKKLDSLVAIFSNDIMKKQFEKEKGNISIGLENGTSWEEALNNYHIKNKIYFSTLFDLVLQLRENKLDGIILDTIQYHRMAKHFNSQNVIQKLSIPETFVIYGMGIIIKKENKKIFDILSDGIKILFADGIIKDLERKWNLIEE